MAHFVGLDVSVKETSVCVVDDAGKVILEQKVPTEPDTIIALLTSLGVTYGRIGRYSLLQDHLAGIIDHAHRRLFHRHIKTHEICHLIAPSSMSRSNRPRSTHRRRRGCTLSIQG